MALVFDRLGGHTYEGQGLLQGEHFQTAYLTNDIDHARALFAEHFGVSSFRRLTGTIPSGGEIHVELAWVGSVMLELMHTKDSTERIYRSQPRADEPFNLVHHHQGYVAADRQQWERVLATCEDSGFDIAYRNRTEGFLEVCFIDVPWLPHYLEYFLLEPAGRAFLHDVPRNPSK